MSESLSAEERAVSKHRLRRLIMKTVSRSDALRIIDKWCNEAHARGLRKHQAEFWTVRDILEGVVRVPPWRRKQAIEFVKTCKASDEQDAILKAMEVKR